MDILPFLKEYLIPDICDIVNEYLCIIVEDKVIKTFVKKIKNYIEYKKDENHQDYRLIICENLHSHGDVCGDTCCYFYKKNYLKVKGIYFKQSGKFILKINIRFILNFFILVNRDYYINAINGDIYRNDLKTVICNINDKRLQTKKIIDFSKDIINAVNI